MLISINEMIEGLEKLRVLHPLPNLKFVLKFLAKQWMDTLLTTLTLSPTWLCPNAILPTSFSKWGIYLFLNY